jgi:hypothetical protein
VGASVATPINRIACKLPTQIPLESPIPGRHILRIKANETVHNWPCIHIVNLFIAFVNTIFAIFAHFYNARDVGRCQSSEQWATIGLSSTGFNRVRGTPGSCL